MAKISFKLGIEVLLPINLVNKRVKTNTILAVLVKEIDFNGVYFLETELGSRYDYVVVFEQIWSCLWSSIDRVVVNFDPTEVKKDVMCWSLLYSHLNRDRSSVPLSTWQVKLDIVGNISEALSADHAVCLLDEYVLFVVKIFHSSFLL